MTIKTVRATITLQIFPYLNNGQLCKKITEDAKKIASGFQVRDVKPTCGTVQFVFRNLTDVQRKRLASNDDLIMYARAVSNALGCEVVRMPARFVSEYSGPSKATQQSMFQAKLEIRMNKVFL